MAKKYVLNVEETCAVGKRSSVDKSKSKGKVINKIQRFSDQIRKESTPG